MSRRDDFKQVAEQTPYDNSDCDLIATDTKSAIDEICTKVSTSASPGFGFGKGGNVSSNAYLLCEGVTSNLSGRYVYINNAVITRVFISVQNAATFDIEVFSHDGNETNLTSLAMRIVNGSAKNAVGGLELQGNN
jgi:hypothetical protein